MLWNSGRPQHEWLLQLPLLALGALGLWLAAPLGITAAAIAVGLLSLARALLLTGAALSALQLRWSSLALPTLRGLILSAGAAALVLAVQMPLAADLLLPRLMAAALTPVLPVALLLWLRPHWCEWAVGPQAWAMVLRFVPTLGREPRPHPLPAAGLHRQHR